MKREESKYGIKQITKEEAIALYNSGAWEEWSDDEIVTYQLFQKLLAVPFGRFHQAIEKVLGRPVYTHEFGLNLDGLVEEFWGEKPKPTLEEIVNLIPEEKRIIIIGGGL